MICHSVCISLLERKFSEGTVHFLFCFNRGIFVPALLCGSLKVRLYWIGIVCDYCVCICCCLPSAQLCLHSRGSFKDSLGYLCQLNKQFQVQSISRWWLAVLLFVLVFFADPVRIRCVVVSAHRCQGSWRILDDASRSSKLLQPTVNESKRTPKESLPSRRCSMILPDTSGFLTDYHEMRKLNKTKGNAMKPDEFFECFFFILGEEGGGILRGVFCLLCFNFGFLRILEGFFKNGGVIQHKETHENVLLLLELFKDFVLNRFFGAA